MQKAKLLIFIVSLGAVLCISCNKDNTVVTGPTGATGRANVKYSGWNTLSMQFSSGDSLYEQTIKVDSLTQPILDSGIVLTYLKSNSSPTQIVNANAYMDEVYSVGSINLYSSYDYSGFSYRYIIIPGGVSIKNARVAASALQIYTKKQPKEMSYEDVIKLMGEN